MFLTSYITHVKKKSSIYFRNPSSPDTAKGIMECPYLFLNATCMRSIFKAISLDVIPVQKITEDSQRDIQRGEFEFCFILYYRRKYCDIHSLFLCIEHCIFYKVRTLLALHFYHPKHTHTHTHIYIYIYIWCWERERERERERVIKEKNQNTQTTCAYMDTNAHKVTQTHKMHSLKKSDRNNICVDESYSRTINLKCTFKDTNPGIKKSSNPTKTAISIKTKDNTKTYDLLLEDNYKRKKHVLKKNK